MDIKVELRGAKELAAFLQQAPTQVALKAGKGGLAKSAPRLRTLLRRAAPKKTGFLRTLIKAVYAKKDAFATVGLKGRKAGIYYTTEYGRKPHTRLGKPRKGSPQMAKHWFASAWASHQAYIAQVTVDATRSAFIKEAGRLAAKTRAPIKIKGGSR